MTRCSQKREGKTMKQWLLVMATCALLLAGVVGVQAQDNTSDTFLCENIDGITGGAIVVTGGLDNIFDAARSLTGSTYCRLIVRDSQVVTQLAEIGNIEVVSRGVIQATNLIGLLPAGETWNSFRTPVRVCMRGIGEIQFLQSDDLNNSARTLQSVAVEGRDGYTCADVNGAGVVALTPEGANFGGGVGTSTGVSTLPASVPAADPSTVVELDNCEVTTKVKGVFIRRGPGTNNRIRWQLEANQTLTATGIAGQWYRVDFRGTPGWIAAPFVYPMGNCLSPEGHAVGMDDPYAPGDATAYTSIHDCELVTNFNGVNLRREPSVRASIRWTFEDSQTLQAVGVSGNWYLIAFRGSPGWIHSDYVNVSGTCAVGEATPQPE